jgi:hypothetical protein
MVTAFKTDLKEIGDEIFQTWVRNLKNIRHDSTNKRFLFLALEQSPWIIYYL